mmetsp:Transcript_102814/g.294754  ORF Transcript_102814/g.294754 Transcript_102814/m.294754 type:complete len:207 (+) Transcript_102814:252-872(+)
MGSTDRRSSFMSFAPLPLALPPPLPAAAPVAPPTAAPRNVRKDPWGRVGRSSHRARPSRSPGSTCSSDSVLFRFLPPPPPPVPAPPPPLLPPPLPPPPPHIEPANRAPLSSKNLRICSGGSSRCSFATMICRSSSSNPTPSPTTPAPLDHQLRDGSIKKISSGRHAGGAPEDARWIRTLSRVRGFQACAPDIVRLILEAAGSVFSF